MTIGGFSPRRLARVRDVLERHVDAGYVPGAVAVVARHGEVHIEATGSLAFEGGGLVSTAADYLAFASALLAGGTRRGERVLSRPSVTLMTADHLTPAQKAVSGFTPGYFDDIGWGFGMSVRTRRTHPEPAPGVSYPWAASAGSYGWPGVYGTGWYNDPAEDMTTILMIQRAPAPPGLPILIDFWTAAYQAIDD
jgi:CubicO group peptidase (beta-lactamase class C family)